MEETRVEVEFRLGKQIIFLGQRTLAKARLQTLEIQERGSA